jgi:xylose dehydrogenase (NAD/NADP)
VTTPVGFGVIGAKSYVANAAVMPAIDAATNATLVATASRSGRVDPRWASTQLVDYDAVLQHPGVDVVYIPLPNGMHREWTERAAAAGKHVLCEKPLAAEPGAARAMADACIDAGVLLAEAWMTPFDRRWSTTLELARSGAIGRVEAQYHRFTFTIGPEAADNYRWDPAQGGGALLDVGIYCLGTAVALWGPDCEIDAVDRAMAPSGVDATTVADLIWPGDRHAQIRCSFIENDHQQASFHSADAMLLLERAAFTSGDELDHVIVRSGPRDVLDGLMLDRHVPPSVLAPTTEAPDAEPNVVEQFTVPPGDPYRGMIEAFANAVRGVAEWPRPVERSIELLQLLDRIARFGASPHA